MTVDYLGEALREAAILAFKEQGEVAAAELVGAKSVEFECVGWRHYWTKMADYWALTGTSSPALYYVPTWGMTDESSKTTSAS